MLVLRQFRDRYKPLLCNQLMLRLLLDYAKENRIRPELFSLHRVKAGFYHK